MTCAFTKVSAPDNARMYMQWLCLSHAHAIAGRASFPDPMMDGATHSYVVLDRLQSDDAELTQMLGLPDSAATTLPEQTGDDSCSF